MTEKEIKSFVLHVDYFNFIQLLSMEDRGRLFTAIFEYVSDSVPKESGEMSAPCRMAFCMIRNVLDRDREKYIERCKMASVYGKRGGRPRSATAKVEDESEGVRHGDEKTQRFSEKPEKAYNNSVNDNENKNENVNISVSDNENENENVNMSVSDNTSPSPSERAHTARISDEERVFLLKKGIPSGYIEAREEKAIHYVSKLKRSADRILLEWWEEDKVWAAARFAPKAAAGERVSSFDTDEFFSAALARSREGEK